MHGRSALLLAGLVAAAITALSAPAMSLAHGHAHAELLEHAGEAHHAPSSAPSVNSHDEEHAHAHSEMGPGLCSRCTKLTPAVQGTPAPALVVTVVLSLVAAPVPVPDESPPRLERDPPNNPRPPPISA
jgi:hypothetical protein